MRQSRKHYSANRKKLANFRAAKERKRIERHSREEPNTCPDGLPVPLLKPSGFRITVECLDDGERVSFTSARLPWGLSVSPTLAGKKVAIVLSNYKLR